MADELYSLEDADGIRMVWNLWPRSKVEALKCVLPFSAMYTPLKETTNLTVAPYEPVACKGCGGILNPHASLDFNTKLWHCPICHTRNHLPAHYSQITPDLLPAELFADKTTIEYQLQRTAQGPPVYIFVVDISVSEDELEACKTTLVQALQMMPEHCLIGLITFGTHVHVHELTQADIPKSYVFRGCGEFTSASIAQQLGLHRSRATESFPAARFLASLADSEFVISQALENLQKDAYQPVAEHRVARCTGTALQVASGLAGSALPPNGCAAHIMLFVGGPCTEGKASMVSKDLAAEIRSHKDLAKDAAPFWRPAVAFYGELGKAMVTNSHTLDVFACALEQSGLAEMKPAVQATGGLAVQTDTFRNPVFKDSLTRVFAKDGEDGFLGRCACATLDVLCSRDIKIQGMLGCGASTKKQSPAVSNTVTGEGGTHQWKLPSLDRTTSVAVVFDINADKNENGAAQDQFFLQFITRYLHWDGGMRCRVTTVCRRWVDGQNSMDLINGFDQEAAAVLTARLATWKMETEEDFDPTRWLDRNLIRLAQRFGEYRKDDAQSFQMMQEMAFFPGFMFHLRRSQFVQVFGNSPDETAYARLLLMKEHARNSILMLQPQLFSYGMAEEPRPAHLDVSSILPDRILFLDSYFSLVVFHGTSIAQWRQAGYQTQPEYAEFAALLQAPQDEASQIVRTRFPVPRLVDADNHTVQGRSQARFLLVKLNPSSTHTTAETSGEVILTDDVSLDHFLFHLKKLAVQS